MIDISAVEKVVNDFNEKSNSKCTAGIARVDSYRIVVCFRLADASDSSGSDDHVINFLRFLNEKSGNQYDIVRLFRPYDGHFIAVFVPDNDRIKEVVDFGFDPFDLLL
ncbi:MAG TPA: hypothetical protein PKU94_05680 [Candidatus Hydrothermia bacterium]|nr:hypothetical protein [Candidatus Hydrothermae bacterium]MDD3648517.1 hypothetical protein [Candidatus Hydrothermia bacterium]MDD5572483.1 hypothetical protein [Candidatus Hydrothermia bacterium]HOK23726.1 hypothetical protein [Candidatus Hydrothermia bacterium]HOL24435.1 hypothetical protein [Candidatus Hydrothermia bacterium]